jgi:hypothetical protein
LTIEEQGRERRERGDLIVREFLVRKVSYIRGAPKEWKAGGLGKARQSKVRKNRGRQRRGTRQRRGETERRKTAKERGYCDTETERVCERAREEESGRETERERETDVKRYWGVASSLRIVPSQTVLSRVSSLVTHAHTVQYYKRQLESRIMRSCAGGKGGRAGGGCTMRGLWRDLKERC